ncbi:STM3941 family protein [Mucilaginibacter sp.]|uniref:STM3941 family protein n=1 Tax=Mucilaginibacter sp. TaxID=1882438 RepID=UPI0025F2D662|nr:STM3941 family protein [Mucilaginibacter sp.]
MNQSNPAIEVPLSKTKTLLVILGGFVFVLLSIWMWDTADTQTRWPPICLRVLSVIGGAFFGSALIVGPKKLFDKRPGLIISDEGIQDNCSISRGRFIAWKNIQGFKIVKIRSTKLILVFINNAKEVIQEENKFTQALMRVTEKTYGTPISISSGTLKIDSDDLLQLLLDRQLAVKAIT